MLILQRSLAHSGPGGGPPTQDPLLNEAARVVVTCSCGCVGTVTVLTKDQPGKVRLGFDFPKSVTIDRAEVARSKAEWGDRK